MNYKDEIVKRLSREDLIEQMPVTPLMVEKYEVEQAGGFHSPKCIGPDGQLTCGRHQEIKTQRWMGVFPLCGRGKFSAPSYTLHDAKLKSNELITVIGYHEATGEQYYKFSFDFNAIADNYYHAVEKGWNNYDTIPLHYANHSSFNVDYIVNGNVLERDSRFFQPKFFNFLKDCK